MCCPTKENTCFLVGQTFRQSYRWFNCLPEILLIFGRNKLCTCLRKLLLSGITHSCLYDQRKEAGSGLSKEFRQICSLPHFRVPVILPRWNFSKRFFSTFLFRYFFLGSDCKSRIVFRRRSWSYLGGDSPLTRLSPTPSTLSDKAEEKYTLAYRGKSEVRLHTFPYSVFVFLGGFYTPAS